MYHVFIQKYNTIQKQLIMMFISLIAAGAVSGRVPKSLHQVSLFELPTEAKWTDGMSEQGDIVLHDYNSETLGMYQYNRERYSLKWAGNFPDEIDPKKVCYKCISSRGELFLQNGTDEDTICYSNSMHKQYSVSHKGKLINIIDGELFYLEKFGNNQYKIVINSAGSSSHTETSQREVLSLPLTLLPQWRVAAHYPSVCRVQQCYVVVEYYNRALDVFDLKGMFLIV